MLNTHDAITVPDPDQAADRIRATFREIAVGQPFGRDDSAWVVYEEGHHEGLPGRVRYWDIKAAG